MVASCCLERLLATLQMCSKACTSPRLTQGSPCSCCGWQMVDVPEHYLATHHVLLEDFANVTQWPKHLLIQYSWQELEPLHAQAGLYVLFITGEAVAAWPPVCTARLQPCQSAATG